MKTITYNLDEKLILQKAMQVGNPEHEPQYINKIIDEAFNNSEFGKYKITIELSKGTYKNIIIDCSTNLAIHSEKLPILVRNMNSKIFNKLYWQYCN